MSEIDFGRYSMLDFGGLETPSKYLTAGPSSATAEGITPGINLSEWTTGLTPSLFKSSSKGKSDELNPFDSLYQPKSRPGSSLATHQHSSSLSTSTNDHSPTKPDEPTGQGSALNKLGLFFPQQFGGRKRALSSPALLTPNLGLSSFDFGEFPLAAGADATIDLKTSTASIQPSSLSISTLPEPKRIKTETSNSSDSSPALFDRPASGASLSPDSSAVVTPPDLVVSMPSIETQLSASQTPKAVDLPVDLNGTFDPSSLFDTNGPMPDGAGALPYEQFFIPGFDMNSITADSGMFAMPGFATQPSFGSTDSSEADRKPNSAAGPSGSSSPQATNTKKGAAAKPAAKGAASKKKGAAAKGAPPGAGEDSAEAGEGSQVDPEEAEKRASHLERNRIAACKSRQKKKMKVNALETQAAEVSAQNAAIQQRALQLQQEVYHLRSLLDAHQGCNCEHVRGYLAREAAGGGIPTIHALAGRVLSLDYTNSPKLGSSNDVYSNLGPAPPVIRPLVPMTGAPAPPVQLGAPIPIARKRNSEPSPAQAPTPVQVMAVPPPMNQFGGRQPIPVLAPNPAPAPAAGLGMLTRSKRSAGTDEAGPGFEQAVLGRQMSAQMQLQVPGGRMQKPKLRHGRSNSVPLAATPGWEGVNHAAGSYFPQLV